MPGSSHQATPPASSPKKPHHAPRPRHAPQRTCVACKQVRPKRELLRIVRTPQGHVELDPTGKKAGRGSYLCARRSCWDLALKKNRLEHEFELTLDPADRATLEAFVDTLPTEDVPAATRVRRKKVPTVESAP